MNIIIQNLKIGDVLIRTKGIFKHFGIFIGLWNGQYIVAENNPKSGVKYITLNQFLSGKPLQGIEYFKGTESERQQIIPYINSIIGRNYDLVNYNCEHFANEVQTGKAHSKQVKIFGLVSGIAITYLLTSKTS